jgi:hypothetical protein
MKRNKLYLLASLPLLLVLLVSSVMTHNGSPGAKTGSPGDGGATCTDCHGGTAQTVTGWITSNIPVTGYVPGQTYTITATATHTGAALFGFELTAENAANAKKGTFIITNAVETKLINANKAVTHTTNGTNPTGNGRTWNMNWTAPVAGTGAITFYAAFNAANGNGASTGDVIYKSSRTVSEYVAPQTTLTLNLTGMTPHIGQLFEARLIDKLDLKEIDRKKVPSVSSASFSVVFDGIENGHSYFIDFYADMSGNGLYDPPATDHAWRLSADNINGGASVNFVHNTNFTDINWRYLVTLNLTGMNPHIGQKFEARLVNINRNMKEVGRTTITAVAGAAFSVKLPFAEAGHSYYVEFYADMNGNGRFDPSPADHTWRLEAMNTSGDVSLNFAHSTNFTDIPWKGLLNVQFSGMNPHLGQEIKVRLIDNATGKEAGRATRIADLTTFTLGLPCLENGKTYQVDFYADMNENGIYDAPPADHAWRLASGSISGDKSLTFIHNTTFTDIGWSYLITLHASEMTPHLGQLFEMRITNTQSFYESGRVIIPELLVPEIFLELPGHDLGQTYNIDFYADFNENGGYDPPPADHAWRIVLEGLINDSVVDFVHNMDFTDIDWTVNVPVVSQREDLKIFPNPFADRLWLNANPSLPGISEILVLDARGEIVLEQTAVQRTELSLNTGGLKPGVYFMKVRYLDGNSTTRKIVRF